MLSTVAVSLSLLIVVAQTSEVFILSDLYLQRSPIGEKQG